MQTIKRFNPLGSATEVLPTQSAVNQYDWSNFIMAPGVYSYNTPNYDLSEEGLYMIFNANVDGGYRHIYNGDVAKLMSSLSQMTIYGRADEGLSNSQLLSTIKTRKVALRCNLTIGFIQYVLNSLGIENRMCRVLTADTPNNVDDGHSPMEVKINGEWVLYDPPSSRYFIDSSDDPINLDGYFLGNVDDHVKIADNASDNTPNQSYAWASDVFFDCYLRDESELQAWIDRIYQIPGIVDTDGKTYYYMPSGTSSRQSWVENLDPNYIVLSYSDWYNRFYS